MLKRFLKKEKSKYLICFSVILLVSLILFSGPLFSNRILGLDGLGHLSKITYMKNTNLSSWNYAWYSGTPTNQFYSPLIFIIASLFSNSIFAINFFCYLSILLTSMGIFLLVDKFSNKIYSLFSSLLFLSVLSISYYWLSVGNIAYVFAFWTIPFGMYFLEKSFQNRKWFLGLSFVLVLSVLSHIFIAMCLFFILGIRILFYSRFNIKDALKNGIIYLLPGFLISCFWFIPFLSHSSSFVGKNAGYIPNLFHLFGFGRYLIWGVGSGKIGIAFFLLVFSFFYYKKWKSEYSVFLISIIAFFLFFLLGGLGKFYPEGVSAVRFIIPLSIFICVFVGVAFSKLNCSKYFVLFLFLILIGGLAWNFIIIQENFSKYSYSSDLSGRRAFIEDFAKDSRIEINNSFDNYRFGAYSYIFSEGLNYVFPLKSQTRGYFDQGMLKSEITKLFFDKVWFSNDLNSTFYFLEWFGIDYFEFGGNSLEFESKFELEKFEKIIDKEYYDSARDYLFSVYKFKEASPIILYARGNIVSYNEFDFEKIVDMSEEGRGLEKEIPIYTDENILIENDFELFDLNYTRDADELAVNFDYENESFILFKEFYHNSWGAKDLNGKKLKIYETGPGFMLVFPYQNSEGVIFYQKNTFENYFGALLSLIGIILLINLFFNSKA